MFSKADKTNRTAFKRDFQTEEYISKTKNGLSGSSLLLKKIPLREVNVFFPQKNHILPHPRPGCQIPLYKLGVDEEKKFVHTTNGKKN